MFRNQFSFKHLRGEEKLRYASLQDFREDGHGTHIGRKNPAISTYGYPADLDTLDTRNAHKPGPQIPKLATRDSTS